MGGWEKPSQPLQQQLVFTSSLRLRPWTPGGWACEERVCARILFTARRAASPCMFIHVSLATKSGRMNDKQQPLFHHVPRSIWGLVLFFLEYFKESQIISFLNKQKSMLLSSCPCHELHGKIRICTVGAVPFYYFHRWGHWNPERWSGLPRSHKW